MKLVRQASYLSLSSGVGGFGLSGLGGEEVGDKDGDDEADGTRTGVKEGFGFGIGVGLEVEDAEGEMGITEETSLPETKNRPILGRKRKVAVRNTALKAKTIRILLIPFRVAWGRRWSKKACFGF